MINAPKDKNLANELGKKLRKSGCSLLAASSERDDKNSVKKLQKELVEKFWEMPKEERQLLIKEFKTTYGQNSKFILSIDGIAGKTTKFLQSKLQSKSQESESEAPEFIQDPYEQIYPTPTKMKLGNAHSSGDIVMQYGTEGLGVAGSYYYSDNNNALYLAATESKVAKSVELGSARKLSNSTAIGLGYRQFKIEESDLRLLNLSIEKANYKAGAGLVSGKPALHLGLQNEAKIGKITCAASVEAYLNDKSQHYLAQAELRYKELEVSTTAYKTSGLTYVDATIAQPITKTVNAEVSGKYRKSKTEKSWEVEGIVTKQVTKKLSVHGGAGIRNDGHHGIIGAEYAAKEHFRVFAEVKPTEIRGEPKRTEFLIGAGWKF